ncbi:ABC transporter substrate-binding protein [Ruegeria pomeroyi]|uniref:ABC transporter substrate-binding protein n=1 Tax=Ruegeria pomeroyi TaxID=89184 RepID=A0A9Q3WHC7_9RHOB|nr:ABC transporter substrate-binding protein [Ruegeria pomeroyi]MCE8535991.1 ABC transporter substrate-binding protein [Ruegeria pomeroyi]
MITKALAIGTATAALLAGATMADEVKIGLIAGFTGPIESLAGPIAAASEMAFEEASDSGKFLGGSTILSVRGDGTCIDAAAATATAVRLVTADGVKGIIGENCSGVTGAILSNVAVPNGIVQISPSATSPALSTAEDNDLFFRTAPSDARQGEVMAQILMDNGVNTVAVTYTNSDYGKGISESFESAYTALGGKITMNAAHEDGKADYSAEIGALAAAGGDVLVVLGYLDQGGGGMVRASLDSGAFDTFHFADGMIGASMEERFGADLDGSRGQHPGSNSEGAKIFVDLVGGSFDAASPYAPESYDAAALMILAMQAAGSTESADYKSKIFEVANAPGEKINPGELAKALEILAAGGDIDYVGATDVELIGPGEAAGSFREVLIQDGKFTTAGYR